MPNGVIDIKELHTYIEPSLVVRNRNLEHKDFPNSSKRFIYPMRICRDSDFTSRSVEVSESFSKRIKIRLCPDIEKDDQNYVI
jgi:hypothetical protein